LDVDAFGHSVFIVRKIEELCRALIDDETIPKKQDSDRHEGFAILKFRPIKDVSRRVN